MVKRNKSNQDFTTAAGDTHRLPQHLLVMRNSAMGDVAMLPHAIRALQETYPSLKITIATRPLFRPFFKGLNVEFMDVDLKGSEHSLWGMWKFAKKARKMGVDAFADCHDVLRSKAFRLSMFLHGVPVAHIHKERQEKKRFIQEHRIYDTPLKHTVIRYCDVFRRLHLPTAAPTPLQKQDLAPRPNPMGEKVGTWVGFAPFSAQKGKTYPMEHCLEIVGLLSKKYTRVFIHGGGGEEAAFAEKMEKEYPNVTALWGKVKLEREMDVLSQEDCVISMDSLVMHLASLVATPVVSVWGATHPALGFLGYGCDREGALSAELPCSPCSVYGGKPCIYGDFRCMKAVTPQMVLKQVEVLLKKHAGQSQEPF